MKLFIEARKYSRTLPLFGDRYIRLAIQDGTSLGKNIICVAWGRSNSANWTPEGSWSPGPWRLWLRMGWKIGATGLFRLA